MDKRHKLTLKPPTQAERLEMELEAIRSETPLMLAEYDQLTRMLNSSAVGLCARPPAEFYALVRALTNRFLLLGPLILKHRDRINTSRGGRTCHMLGISAGSVEECIAIAAGTLLRKIAGAVPDDPHATIGPEPSPI